MAKKEIYSLQYLRIIAASMVVLMHVTFSLKSQLNSPTTAEWAFGAKGVDLFFIISGFIMVYITDSAKTAPLKFFFRRFSRVAPTYWLITLVVIGIGLVAPSLLKSGKLDIAHVIASFLFIPWDHPVNISTFPVLQVGWSLNAEAEFYTIFAISMAISHKLRVFTASLFILFLVTLGYIFEPANETLAALTSTVMIEFVFGMVIASLHISRIQFQDAFGIIMLSAGVIWLFLFDVNGVYDKSRWYQSGLPAFLIVWSLVNFEMRRPFRMGSLMDLMSRASYALYLTHFFVVGLLREVWPPALVGGIFFDLLFIFVLFATSWVVAILFYQIVERPLVRWASVFADAAYARIHARRGKMEKNG